MEALKILVVDDESRMRKLVKDFQEMVRKPWIFFIKKRILH